MIFHVNNEMLKKSLFDMSNYHIIFSCEQWTIQRQYLFYMQIWDLNNMSNLNHSSNNNDYYRRENKHTSQK